MIKYGLDTITELKFKEFNPIIERRDDQWVDIVLRPELDSGAPIPDDLIAFSILVICTLDGTIVQIVPQDEDCDCEYQCTFSEKEQIKAFIEQNHIQTAIANLTSP
ncbi:hypothetical protein I6N90_07985 [Paenibacillus sp. GSMTC-2017]|uniref:hypothetical protein n=1 Tax=Paenibacillus sp. GSMTC-2017 TaxID=2794350 RepID=UPI0018DA1D0A|nr:hypothetical protein [Paenibacillus sp. GSMTC-2017]MBH5317741.1 hypothetical protein [Paenibacillus sp. GSMTC-2017]